mmetsp:Transcript_16240/g.34032  ORF Transcript_16240/g.34032 Transcript_16240/m.34032 type:complete len:218 (+) Transcript_16240:1124-1777(+)
MNLDNIGMINIIQSVKLPDNVPFLLIFHDIGFAQGLQREYCFVALRLNQLNFSKCTLSKNIELLQIFKFQMVVFCDCCNSRLTCNACFSHCKPRHRYAIQSVLPASNHAMEVFSCQEIDKNRRFGCVCRICGCIFNHCLKAKGLRFSQASNFTTIRFVRRADSPAPNDEKSITILTHPEDRFTWVESFFFESNDQIFQLCSIENLGEFLSIHSAVSN